MHYKELIWLTEKIHFPITQFNEEMWEEYTWERYNAQEWKVTGGTKWDYRGEEDTQGRDMLRWQEGGVHA
jgi:hypothetical protein